MAKYKKPYEMPYNITPDSKYYLDTFFKEIKSGEGIIGKERTKIAETSFLLFHEYMNEKEQVFKKMYKPIKEMEIDL